MTVRAIGWVLVTLALAGCARQGPPAPVDSGQPGAGASDQPGGSDVADAQARGTVVVRKGDTYSEIAVAHGVSTRALIERNGAEPPYTIYPGDVLILPEVRAYTVDKGDTATKIARCYGVDLRSLVQANRLEAPYVLPVGRKLRIPREIRTPHCPGERPAIAVAAGTPVAVQDEPAASGLPVPAQAAALPIVIPAPAEPGAPPTNVAGESGPVVPAVPIRAAGTAGKSKFLWPAEGTIASRFGTKSGGLRNDGINIAAPVGSPVRATADGTVAYAGNELQAYGNLVLIKHEGGWMSAYAHNDRLQVARGEQVRQGQTIAQVGDTGNVPGPQVHFELRTGKGRPVDPLKHLGQ